MVSFLKNTETFLKPHAHKIEKNDFFGNYFDRMKNGHLLNVHFWRVEILQDFSIFYITNPIILLK